MDKVKFDERITKYGHEDTLFGFELKKNNTQITHIDNPVINGNLETNEEFIEKTEEGLLNLLKIVEFLSFDKAFTEFAPDRFSHFYYCCTGSICKDRYPGRKQIPLFKLLCLTIRYKLIVLSTPSFMPKKSRGPRLNRKGVCTH